MVDSSQVPAVSVVVPVFNDEASVGALLDCLLAQDYPGDRIEIVICDNGSHDRTREVVVQRQAERREFIHLTVEDQVQSSYAARNKAIAAASGEVFAFTDADCRPEPGWVRAAVTALARESATSGGGQIVFTYGGARPNLYEYYDSVRKLQQQVYIEQAGFSATANFFAHRQVFDVYGLFRSDLISGGDYEFGRRLTKNGERMIYVAEAVVHHPARSSFGAIYRKSVRVARGQKQLTRLGLLEQGQVSWRQLLPVRSYPVDARWAPSLHRSERLQLILLQNFFRWLNFFVRRF